ncbi:Zinc-binding dehydrogenase, partial [Apiospora marii]|uniref:Zinc-binding dehydrogenase n=1 Tax=Apiospora marii TaxID=335849 RepID=UPI00312D89D1
NRKEIIKQHSGALCFPPPLDPLPSNPAELANIPMTTPRTHLAVAFAAARQPLRAVRVPTASPQGDEILIRSRFTASTPLDLHRADGGLLQKPGDIFGSTTAGVVEEVGPGASGRLRVGDRVFGWAFQEPRFRAHQEFVTAPEWMFGKIPENISLEEAATVPENLITIFNTMAIDLGLPTPWPKPEGYVPARADAPVLVWGAASSVGQSALQLLRWYGYRHILATASPSHHEYLRGLGASACFDYRDPDVAKKLLAAASEMHGESGGEARETIPYIIDCIGSRHGSLRPILEGKIAQPGSVVAVMLPVILTHASPDQAPEYSMDAGEVARGLLGSGAEEDSGVAVKGVRTFFVYEKSAFFREKLASEMVPALLARGVVRPQRYRLVEGGSILEREEGALRVMREGGVSGVKLVWRTSEE